MVYPNHITIIGDKAIVGIVWEKIIIGYKVFETFLQRYMESAQDIPIITDAISPNSASPSVIRECLYIKSF
ncbi:protein of unknown function [Clostridium beijerinckii]|nr:protein of unknown function [Clostridium beijerinckii]